MRLIAARTTVNAKRAKTPRVEIVAYSGGMMTVPGWGAVAIRLSGLSAGKVALLADHNNDINSILGQGEARIENGAVVIRGQLATGPATRRIIDLSRDGFDFQASVGVYATEQKYIEAGEKISVNGRTLTAPRDGLTLIVAGVLREVSITALGCDADTSVRIAARHHHQETQGKPMFGFRQNIRETRDDFDGDDSIQPIEARGATSTLPPAYDDDAIRAAERQRIQAIDRACSAPSGGWGNQESRVAYLRAQAIEGEISVEALQGELLGAIRAARPTHAATSPQTGGTPGATSIEAALMVRAGLQSVAETQLGARALEDSRSLHSASMVDICRAAIIADGRTPPSSRNDMIRAAFGISTGTMPVALGNAMNKSVLAAYTESRATWRSFAAVRYAKDFKDHTSIRPSWLGQLEQLAPDGEIKHGTYGESTFPWRVDTFAKMLSFTRKDVVNDDLSILDDAAPALARMALRKLSDLVWETILANAGSYFSVANNNLISGASTALSIVSLSEAVKTMTVQRDDESNDIDIVPRVLVVGPDDVQVARELINSAEVNRTGDNEPTGNPFQKSLTLEIESRLSNSTKFTGTSDTQWFLFASPSDVPIIVAYLQGFESPRVEFFGFDSDPNKLAVAWRVYQDFGVAMGDPRAAVKSAGA